MRRNVITVDDFKSIASEKVLKRKNGRYKQENADKHRSHFDQVRQMWTASEAEPAI